MSRFFNKAYNQDASDYSSESDYYSDTTSDSDSSDNSSDADADKRATPSAGAFSKFARQSTSSQYQSTSSASGGKRVVKSLKEKLFEDLRASISTIASLQEQGSWHSMQIGMII